MFLAIIIFAIYVAINVGGVSKVVFGGDSGNIILSYFFGSAAHPPGYPLNTLIGFFLTRVLPGPTFAYKANLLAAIVQSLNLALIFLFLKSLTGNFYVSLSASLFLGFTALFWLYAHVAEVFQLTATLLLLSLLFLFKWYQASSKGKNFRDLTISFLFLGLAVFHHHAVLLIIPAFFYILFKTKKRVLAVKFGILKLFVAFFLGALPYIYIVVVDMLGVLTNWGSPATFGGFLTILTRADYGTFTASSELIGFTLTQRLVQFLWYFSVIKVDFLLFAIILIILGAIYLFAKKRDLFWFTFLGFFFTGPFFIAYATFTPVESFLQGVSERFLLNSYLFLTIFLCFGFLLLFNSLSKLTGKILTNHKLTQVVIGLSLLVFPFYLYLINFPKTDLSKFELGKTIAEDTLNSADPPGIIILQGDTITFNTQYSYYVEGVGGDSQLVMWGRTKHKSYRDKLKKEYPFLIFPAEYNESNVLSYEKAIVEFVNLNFDNRPIYSLEKLPLGEDYISVSQGAVFRLYKKNNEPDAKKIAEKIDESISKFKFKEDLIKGRYLNFFEDDLKSAYVKIYVNNGLEMLRSDDWDGAIKYYERALSINPDSRDALFGSGVSYLNKKDCNRSQDIFAAIVGQDETYWQAWEGLGKVHQDCLKDGGRAADYFKKSSEIRENKSAISIN